MPIRYHNQKTGEQTWTAKKNGALSKAKKNFSRRSMTVSKSTAILVTFAKEPTGTNDRIFDEINTVLRERGIEASFQIKEYEDDYGGPVIYIP